MILLISETPIAGTIERISTWMNRLLEEDVVPLVYRNYPNNSFKLKNGAFGTLPNWEKYLFDAIKQARVVILHNVCSEKLLDVIDFAKPATTPLIYQLHSPPLEGPHFTYQILDERKFDAIWSIGQGHSRFLSTDLVVPNIVNDYTPRFNVTRTNKVFIPHMRTTGNRWSKKVSESDIEFLNRLKVKNEKMLTTIKKTFGRDNVTAEEIRLFLWSTKYVVDDVNTGQIHQTGIEALKSGCLTVSAADLHAVEEFSNTIGAPPLPFVFINEIEDLNGIISFYNNESDYKKKVKDVLEYSDKYLKEEFLAKKYVELTSTFLQ